MKQLKVLTASFLALLLFTLSQCKKKTEEPQLPPETTTGAMTFGCKVNGKVFVPKDSRGRPGLYVQYVYLGSGEGGGWFLNIPANDWTNRDVPSMRIETDSLLVLENASYSMIRNQKGFPYASFSSGSNQFQMLSTDTGLLIINKHNQILRILSGEFWFTATSSNGEKISVTDGRFDIHY